MTCAETRDFLQSEGSGEVLWLRAITELLEEEEGGREREREVSRAERSAAHTSHYQLNPSQAAALSPALSRSVGEETFSSPHRDGRGWPSWPGADQASPVLGPCVQEEKRVCSTRLRCGLR